MTRWLLGVGLLAGAAVAQPESGAADVPEPRVGLVEDRDAGVLRVEIDGTEAITYQYGEGLALPHIWPLRSPGGRSMLVQHPDPYPHHRSLWIADKVQVGDGPVVDFYHCWQNYRESEHPEQGFKSFIRHTGFDRGEAEGWHAVVTASLEWVIEEETVALRESRSFEFFALGAGEYLIDLSWTLTAADGDVKFHSDWVHYAWPFLRMDPAWSGESGGVIEDDQGRRGQEATDGQYAEWIDYSGEVGGEKAGIAVMLLPSAEPRKWLTREYGTFGPRRIDSLSGTGFTLKQGESLEGRAAILVHRGDAAGGRVAERYDCWVEGGSHGD